MEFVIAFRDIDTDNDGVINHEDLIRYRKKMGYTEKFDKKWLSLFDTNRDGVIQLQEFREVLGFRENHGEDNEDIIVAVKSNYMQHMNMLANHEDSISSRSSSSSSHENMNSIDMVDKNDIDIHVNGFAGTIEPAEQFVITNEMIDVNGHDEIDVSGHDETLVFNGQDEIIVFNGHDITINVNGHDEPINFNHDEPINVNGHDEPINVNGHDESNDINGHDEPIDVNSHDEPIDVNGHDETVEPTKQFVLRQEISEVNEIEIFYVDLEDEDMKQYIVSQTELMVLQNPALQGKEWEKRLAAIINQKFKGNWVVMLNPPADTTIHHQLKRCIHFKLTMTQRFLIYSRKISKSCFRRKSKKK